ncbi:MAG: ribosome hibernation-promoting factor, HPF/YfiA family [Thermoleophilia bacterium]
MKIQIKGRHIVVTDALREFAEEKLSKVHKYLGEKHIDEVTRVELELSVEKNPHNNAHSQVAEATVFTRGPVIRAKESSNDMYASIDLVAEKVERQVKKYRDRIQHRAQRHQGKTVDAAAAGNNGGEPEPAPAAGEPVLVLAAPVEHIEPRVVKSKQFALKPMSVEEAALQLELVGHDFFVFTNAETSDTNVVYKRRDGHYGLIEPVTR